jgi:putative serine protease PepD
MGQAYLKVLGGPLDGKSFPINGPDVKIGRTQACDIRLSGYEELSREHARLTWDGSAFTIQDLGSRNGILVDGERVNEKRLAGGDRVTLGDVSLELVMPPDGAPFGGGGAQGAASPPAPAPAPVQSSTPVGVLVAGAAAVVAILVGLYLMNRGKPGAPGGTTPPAAATGVPGTGSPAKPAAATTPPPDSAREMIAATKESTVYIECDHPQGGGSGSGFCAFDPHVIITNAHVVLGPDGKPGDLAMALHSGTDNEKILRGRLECRLAYVDPEHDLAVIRIVGAQLKPLAIGDTDQAHETDMIYAVGYPGVVPRGIRQGPPEPTVQTLRVESLRRNDLGKLVYLQMGGTVTHGNSGGPVVNGAGQVIGVVQRGPEVSAGQRQADPMTGAGISYAIPTELIKQAWEKAEKL